MAKERVFENYRVEVVPTFWLCTNHLKRIDALNRAAAEIKRHVDDIDSCEADCDEVFRCSLCGDRWETTTYTGRPECCEAAMEEWATEQGGRLCSMCGGDGDANLQDEVACPDCAGKGYVPSRAQEGK